MFSFLLHKDTLQTHLTDYQDCKFPFQRTAASPVNPRWCHSWDIPSQVQEFTLLLLSFTRFLSAHSSSLFKSLPSRCQLLPLNWCHPQPCRVLIHAIPSSRFLMKKKMSRVSPSVSPPGTPDCCHLDFQSLTTTTNLVLISSVNLQGYSARAYKKLC